MILLRFPSSSSIATNRTGNIRGWLYGDFQPGLLIKYLKNGAGDYVRKVSAPFELPRLKISARLTGLKNPM